VFWANEDGDVRRYEPSKTDLFVDPEFCDPEADNFLVSNTSVCLPDGNVCGVQIGAFGVGCGKVSIVEESWGFIKTRYRAATER
jgi:hypothetical protein